jgi:UDPglucose 6-dehydrogenase
VSVAIIGHLGIVGAAQAALFGEDHDLVLFDTASGSPYPHDDVTRCDFAVICVGTPSHADDGSSDLTSVGKAIGSLPEKMPVLLRSTVPPGTTDKLAAQRSGLIAFAPEFLTERTGGAWPDSADVPYMILGGSQEAHEFFGSELALVFPGVIHECEAVTAELAKYTANLYWATRVTFVNEMASIASAFGAEWDDVRMAWQEDERISGAYTRMDGFPPGFGGRCWPKDLTALIAAASEAGYQAEFLDSVRLANERFTSE